MYTKYWFGAYIHLQILLYRSISIILLLFFFSVSISTRNAQCIMYILRCVLESLEQLNSIFSFLLFSIFLLSACVLCVITLIIVSSHHFVLESFFFVSIYWFYSVHFKFPWKSIIYVYFQSVRCHSLKVNVRVFLRSSINWIDPYRMIEIHWHTNLVFRNEKIKKKLKFCLHIWNLR